MLRVNGKPLTGLGDVIETVTETTGIKSVVDRAAKAAGRDCGCSKRKDWLNEKFPLGRTRDDKD